MGTAAPARPAGQIPPAVASPRGPVGSGTVPARRPPHPTGLALPPACPYPRHDAQDGVRLPDQGVGVEGAPGFARSVRTPFHRGCTARRPPLGARRRPVRVRGAPAPSPARSRRGPGLPPGGVVHDGPSSRARARSGRRAPGSRGTRVLGARVLRPRAEDALVASAVTSLQSEGEEWTVQPLRTRPVPGALEPLALPETNSVIMYGFALFLSPSAPNIERKGGASVPVTECVAHSRRRRDIHRVSQ